MRTAILSLITTAVLISVAANTANAEIAWESSLRKAHTKASKESKLLLLHFVRDNCIYCDKLEAGAFQTPEVNQTVAKSFVPLKINVSDSKSNRKLAEMFKVDRFPMDVVVTTNGEALAHGISPQQPAQYVNMLVSTLAPNAPAIQKPTGNTPPPTQMAAQTPNQPAPRQSPARNSAPTSATLPSGATAPRGQLASSRSNDGLSLAMPGRVEPGDSPSESTPSIEQQYQAQAQPKQRVPAIRPQPATELGSSQQRNVASKNANEPTLAIDGYCSVSVVKEARWVEGKAEFGVVHLGKLYLFANAEAMQTFLADPIPYTPVLNQIDVVRFFEERVIVPGKREWAMQDPINKRMFFFADKAAMLHFENEYERYVDAALMIMEKAVKEANPGS